MARIGSAPDVPNRFKPANYAALSTYKPTEWCIEIQNRIHRLYCLRAPDSAFSPVTYAATAKQECRDYFERIKSSPLTARWARSKTVLGDLLDGLHKSRQARRKTMDVPPTVSASVVDLTQLTAYQFLYDSTRRSYIMKCLDRFEALSERVVPVDGKFPQQLIDEFDARDEAIAEFERSCPGKWCRK